MYSIGIVGTSGTNFHSTFQSLTVQGSPDFQLSATPLSPGTVTAGASATSTVTVTPLSGFSGMVNLTCGISPAVTPAPTCTLPSSVQVTGQSRAGAVDGGNDRAHDDRGGFLAQLSTGIRTLRVDSGSAGFCNSGCPPSAPSIGQTPDSFGILLIGGLWRRRFIVPYDAGDAVRNVHSYGDGQGRRRQQ